MRFLALDPRSAERWSAALAQTPLFAAPRAAPDPLWCVVAALCAGGSLLLTNGWRLAHDAGVDLALHCVRVGVAVASVALCALLAARGWRDARAPHRVGRFLYPWGFAEVLADRLRFVRGDALLTTVTMRGPIPGLPSRVRVRLATEDGWSVSFDVPGGELDVPFTQLEALATTRLDTSEGYRDAARGWLRGAPAGASWSGPTTFAIVGAAALVGALVPIGDAWRVAHVEVAQLASPLPAEWIFDRSLALDRGYPYFGWVHDATARARAGLAADAAARAFEELRPAYRPAMRSILGDLHPSVARLHVCELDDEVLDPVRAFAREHGLRGDPGYRPTHVDTAPHLERYVSFARRWSHGTGSRLRFRSDCWLEPVAIVERPPRVTLRAHAEWSVRLDADVVAARRVTLEPEAIEEVLACAAVGRDRTALQLHVVGRLLRAVVHDDFYEPGRGSRVDALDTLDELAPCVERVARTIEAERPSGSPR